MITKQKNRFLSQFCQKLIQISLNKNYTKLTFPQVKVKLGTQKITLWITKGIKTKTVRQAFEKPFYTKQKKTTTIKRIYLSQ